MKTAIRLGTAADTEQAARVLLAAYNMADMAEARAAYQRETEMGHRYLVAEAAGAIVGISSWYLHGVPHHGLAELDRIAVLPEYRMNGAGKRAIPRPGRGTPSASTPSAASDYASSS